MDLYIVDVLVSDTEEEYSRLLLQGGINTTRLESEPYRALTRVGQNS